MSGSVQPIIPIYGTAAAPCPPPPEGNKKLIGYMQRLQQILVQLAASQDKGVAIDRLAVLMKEMDTVKFSSC